MADTNLTAILKSLEPVFEKLTGRPHGVGFTLHIAPDKDSGIPGYIFRCAGQMGPNPRFEEDAAFDPPAEVLIQHVIGVITKGPSSDDFLAIENPRDAVFALDPSQTATWDPATCLCHCGQPVVL